MSVYYCRECGHTLELSWETCPGCSLEFHMTVGDMARWRDRRVITGMDLEAAPYRTAAQPVTASDPKLPRIIWHGLGVDDDGKQRTDFPLRIVEVRRNEYVIESSYRDSMGAVSWKSVDMSNNWILRALVSRMQGLS
jgi:hypothetical protein